jgi:tetratricopeptide (TPR) repeat protein
MKRIMTATLLALAIAPVAVAQAPSGARQPQQTTTPGTPSQTPAQPTAPGAGHLPGTKAQPQATSQEEYNGYLAVVQAPDLTAAETAANDFATKFPNSNLRGAVYHLLMMKYSQQDNVNKTIEMGRKAVQVDPDNPVVLGLLASTLSETAREADLDFDEKAAEVVKLAEHAIQTTDTNITVPPTVTAEQLEVFRAKIKALAHGAMGKVLLQKNDFAGAEKHLRQAIELSKANPGDAANDHLRLSITLDKQRRYPEALEQARLAMTLAPAGSPTANLAKQQHDRLAKLAPGGAGASTTTSTPAAGTPPATPPGATTPPPPPQKPQGTTPR